MGDKVTEDANDEAVQGQDVRTLIRETIQELGIQKK